MKYGRLRTKDGHYIGSKWIKKNKDWTRTNYSVLVCNSCKIQTFMEVDKWAAFPKRQPEYISKKFYGNVEYYLVYEFDSKTYMLAYIHWAADIEQDNIGLLSFSRYGTYEFIDIYAIDHCVGFFQLGNIYYIIDKESIYLIDE